MSSECTVYAWAGFGEMDSSSPYCLKVVYAARYLKIPLHIKIVNQVPSWAKRGALPVAEINQQHFEDSSEILRHLNSLSPESKLYPKHLQLETQVWEDWADENLSLPLVYFRWIDEANWIVFKEAAFKAIPAILKPLILPFIRKQIRGHLKSAGYLQRSESQKLEPLALTIKLIDERLSQQPYMLGSAEITAADITVYSFFVSMLATNPPQFRTLFEDKKSIQLWMQNMKKLTSL